MDRTPVFDVPFTHDQCGDVPEGLALNPGEARRLLDAAGWRLGPAGIRERQGVPLRFEVLTTPDQSFARAAVVVQARLRDVGAATEIATMEAQVAAERIKAGRFDAALSVINNDLDGDRGHDAFFGPSSIIAYRSDDAARLLERAGSVDSRETDAAFRARRPVFERDLPVTFLYPLVRTNVALRRVQGLHVPYGADPLWHAGQLRIDDGR